MGLDIKAFPVGTLKRSGLQVPVAQRRVNFAWLLQHGKVAAVVQQAKLAILEQIMHVDLGVRIAQFVLRTTEYKCWAVDLSQRRR